MTNQVIQHSQEVQRGERFEFGDNWRQFLSVLNEERIIEAERSLRAMLGKDTLSGLRFIDIGSGSGLFSLAARRLGAAVFSFDYDPQSVACTAELKRRYFFEDNDWQVEQGSALDDQYLAKLGKFDVVYSWGVLHHTGEMWKALKNVMPLIANQGTLFIAIYNDQGGPSRRWLAAKRFYNRSPGWLRKLMVLSIAGYWELNFVLIRLVRGQNPLPFKDWKLREERGMSVWHDWVDWIGGYPFEVAKPEQIFDFYRDRGFILTKLKTCGGGIGCNEFVFRKVN